MFITISFQTLEANNIIGDKNACLGDEKVYSTITDQVIRWEAIGGEINGPNCLNNVEVIWNRLSNCSIKLFYTSEYTGVADSISNDINVISRPSPFVCGSQNTCINSKEEYTYISPNTFVKTTWEISNGLLLSSSDADTITVLWYNSGIGIIKVLATNENGCTDATETPIQINPSIEPEIFGNADVCQYQYEDYSAESLPNAKYEWTIDKGRFLGYANSKEVSVIWDSLGIGSITVEQINQNTGCSRSFTKNVSVSDVPSVTLDEFHDICYSADKFELFGGEPEGGYYTGDCVRDTYLDVIMAGVGDHKIMYNRMNSNQCVGSAVAILTIRPLPKAPIIAFDNQTLYAETDNDVQWYFNDNILNGAINKTLKPNYSGTYSAKASNFYGCKSILSNTINIDIASVNEILNTGQFSISQTDKEIQLTSKNKFNSVAIYDLSGSEIIRNDVADYQLTVSKSALLHQTYIIMILTNDGKVETIKFQN